MIRASVCITVASMLAAPAAAVQSAARDTVVVPGERYDAGALHQWLFGPHYRAAWTQPVRVPVLDLSRFAGGLTPLRKGGGLQTISLRLRGANGREYAFRSIDKDPSAILPAALRETLVSDIVQDQISSGHPMGALVVPPILEAVAVLHADPQVVVMPDDPRLGEFRTEFAGMLGLIEERPEEGSDTIPGFMGASNIVGTERLLERLEEEVEKVDARAFLAARLTDVFLGDWDRHRDQWNWARFAETRESLWQPVPRDRDQAFVKFDGALLAIARQYFPQLVKFGDDYGGPLGITWNGRELDRRLLVELDWPVWDSVANALREQISDAVIDQAVAALPDELEALDGEALRRSLRSRRDKLPEFAHRFYRLLAGEVDVHTTDAAEVVNVRRLPGEELAIDITARTPTGDVALFHRTFRPDDTKEVRLFLHGGADSTLISGEADADITVRVIGGGDNDVFVDASPAGSDRFYDSDGANTFVSSRGTHIDEREWSWPGPEYPPSQPPRDWGRLYRFPLWMFLAPDIGLLVGGGMDRTQYGFRQYPFASRIKFRAAVGTSPRRVRAELDARFHRENSRTEWAITARASGLDILRFHGFGNETEVAEVDEFYLVDQTAFAIDSRLVLALADNATLSAGPIVKLIQTDEDQGRLIGALRPYGIGTFGQAGGRAELRVDTRNRERAATSGVLLSAGGSVYPAFWDVQETFGDVRAAAAVFLSAAVPLQPTLALRAGGRKVMGDYPFFEAATIGDDATVRLGRKERYAGDSEVHLNAELRLMLFRAKVVLPADFGVFGLADTGRVFLKGEESDRWHNAAGGGLWVAFLQPENTLSVAIARSRERTGIYVGAGFAF
jgi:hypothetical protein